MRRFTLSVLIAAAISAGACKNRTDAGLSSTAYAAGTLKCMAKIQSTQDLRDDTGGKEITLQPQGGEPPLYGAKDGDMTYMASVDEELGVIDYEIRNQAPDSKFQTLAKGFYPENKARRRSSALEITTMSGRFRVYCEKY